MAISTRQIDNYSVSTFSARPLTGNKAGDQILTRDTGLQYYWTGSIWTPMGSSFPAGSFDIDRGFRDASTNTPTIVSGAGTLGRWYTVSVAGSTLIDGESVWAIGDYIRWNASSSTREKVDNQTPGLRVNRIVTTATYTAIPQNIVRCQLTTGNTTISLPSANRQRQIIIIKDNTSVYPVIINPNGADTIMGSNNATIFVERTTMTLYSNGAGMIFIIS